MHQGCVAGANEGEEDAAGGGRHRQALGGAGGVLHSRAGHRPRTVPVWPRRVPRPLVWRWRFFVRAAGRSIPRGLPWHVRGPPPRHRRAPRPSARPQRGAGLDVVLRPTKSVSILYGLGDAATGRAVLAAHHAGVAEATAYLDEHLGTRRGHGGHQHVDGRGLLAVGFDHRTSREGDPLLHTHLVVANRVQGPDGRWTALDGRDLYRHRLAADAIYRAAYQRELARSLGVEWTAADRHGNRELQGLPEGCCGPSPSAQTRSTWRSSGSRRPDGSGHPGWSSGPSTPRGRPSSRRRRTPCTDDGGRRQPTAAWTRTPWSGR
jgi:hypothetical protein